MILDQLIVSFRALVVFSLLTGVLYPLAVTGFAQTFFRNKANGSLIYKDGRAIGSERIGQMFDDPRYFWSRLSATAPSSYNGAASSGSNGGPSNPALIASASERIQALTQLDPENHLLVPVDLVTSSASGLDPHITPAAAFYQAGRVARVRGVSLEAVGKLIQKNTEGRFLGILGEPRVNVLKLNLALDRLGEEGGHHEPTT